MSATAADDGPSTPGRRAEPGADGALRRCIATGKIRDRSTLLRFVVGPDGEVIADVAARLPGRGLWLTPHRAIVEQASAKRWFSRAARRPVAVPADLADRIEALLAQRCIDAIGLARRAGLAVAGFERVAEAARRGRAAVLVAAVDGAEGGRRKLRALGPALPFVCALTALELGAAFGRDEVVNASLGGGALGARLVVDAERMAGFRVGAMVERAPQPDLWEPARQNDSIGAR